MITDSETKEINVPNVDMEILTSVIQFLEHHKGVEPPEIQKPLRSTNMHVIVDAWDADYINSFKIGKLFNLIVAANYLDIKSLLQLGCSKIASMIKGKAPEEIYSILKGENSSSINKTGESLHDTVSSNIEGN